MKSLVRPLSAAICAAALLGIGVAQAKEPEEAAAAPQYVVIDEDAQIPFSRNISGYEIGDDGNSILIRSGVSRWYRAEVDRVCARDLRFEQRLPLIQRGGGPIDRFAYVRVNGRRCYFYSFDQIENPHPRVADNH